MTEKKKILLIGPDNPLSAVHIIRHPNDIIIADTETKPTLDSQYLSVDADYDVLSRLSLMKKRRKKMVKCKVKKSSKQSANKRRMQKQSRKKNRK